MALIELNISTLHQMIIGLAIGITIDLLIVLFLEYRKRKLREKRNEKM